MKKTCKKTQSQIEITDSNLSFPIFASILQKLEEHKELKIKKIQNVQFKSEKFNLWMFKVHKYFFMEKLHL